MDNAKMLTVASGPSFPAEPLFSASRSGELDEYVDGGAVQQASHTLQNIRRIVARYKHA